MNQNKESNFETVYIRDEIAKCEDIGELKERIFPMKNHSRNNGLAKSMTLYKKVV